jgi:hypothetical protein
MASTILCVAPGMASPALVAAPGRGSRRESVDGDGWIFCLFWGMVIA